MIIKDLMKYNIINIHYNIFIIIIIIIIVFSWVFDNLIVKTTISHLILSQGLRKYQYSKNYVMLSKRF